MKIRKPCIERPHPSGLGGVQLLYRFKNGLGASVVRSPFSYGSEKGLWVLAVIEFDKDGGDGFKLSYETPITDDVLGYLSVEDVNRILKEIEAL